jgi:hypothetical protein
MAEERDVDRSVHKEADIISEFLSKVLSKEDIVKYAGKFFCKTALDSKHVIAANRNPKRALLKARKRGCANPFCMYNPRADEKSAYLRSPKTQEQI